MTKSRRPSIKHPKIGNTMKYLRNTGPPILNQQNISTLKNFDNTKLYVFLFQKILVETTEGILFI